MPTNPYTPSDHMKVSLPGGAHEVKVEDYFYPPLETLAAELDAGWRVLFQVPSGIPGTAKVIWYRERCTQQQEPPTP